LRPLVIAAILWFGAALAQADSVVNSTGDGGLVYGGKYGCESDFLRSGVCTLRAAIEYANLNPDVDTITFNIPGTAPYTINLGSPLPDLSTNININGPGAAKLTVAGNGAPEFGSPGSFRVFNVTTSGTVTFSGITIANGGLVRTSENGGGIQNANGGTVNVTNCTLTNNYSGEGDGTNFPFGGGAIYNNGTLNVTGSTLRRNVAAFADLRGYGGGAILNNAGTLTIAQTTFEDNHTSRIGGAILNVDGTLTVTGSTFHHNGASGGAGAIYNQGVASVTNSTFVGNIAYSLKISAPAEVYPQGFGGAIANVSNSTLNLSNCTITASFAESGGGVNGGGIVNVKSTIIAGNYAGKFFGAAPDVYGPFVSKGFNLIGKKDGSTGFTAATDKKGTIKAPLDAKLGPLQNNGGPTQTVALQTGSPAIDKGTSASLSGTLTTDQRGTGFPRTVDKAVANATGGDGTDIGAYEAQ
jgi:CSLREA domain-containing protein